MIREFRLGEWRVQPQFDQLVGPSGEVSVEARSMQVLVALAERSGQLASREELLATVWRDSFVEEHVLNRAIWDLRRALGDDPRAPRFIQTLHKRGYRLTSPVSWLDPGVGPTGHYQLVERVGEGGMGVVFKAEDTLLRRIVALKFLPEELSRDAVAKDRLLREARLAANLDHPNLCPIFDVAETTDGRPFLVMPYYEGETLREWLDRPPHPTLIEALRVTTQICSGLTCIHQARIVHRDLKPSNVMMDDGNRPRILDFGLARARPHERSQGFDQLATEFKTHQSKVVGTYPYMSPEQIERKEVDQRSDIFALGIMFYEMVAGERPFKGDSAEALIAAILKDRPKPVHATRADLPEDLGRVVGRCLEKEREKRYQSTEQLQDELEGLLHSLESPVPGLELEPPDAGGEPVEASVEPAPPPEPMAQPRPLGYRLLPWLAAAVAAAVAWSLKPEPRLEPVPDVRFEIPMPPGERLATQYQHGFELSPGGETLAYVSGVVTSLLPFSRNPQVYLRHLDSWESRPVPGGEWSFQPFFSPDGKWLAFLSMTQDGFQLRKTLVRGGDVSRIGDGEVMGATWGTDGTIVVGSHRGGLRRISELGGEFQELTQLDETKGELSHRFPWFLPGSDALVYTSTRSAGLEETAVMVYSLATQKSTQLLEDAMDARYVESGHLLFARNGKLFAAPFDPGEHSLLGSAVPVLDGVSHAFLTGIYLAKTGAAQYSVSGSGVLALGRGSVAPERSRPLVLVDRLGNETTLQIEAKQYLSARISPDGKSILLVTQYPPYAIWLFDLDRGTLARQTFTGRDSCAIWGPGPGQFTFRSQREGREWVFVKDLGTGREEGRRFGEGFCPSSWSIGGQHLAGVVSTDRPQSRPDPAIWIFDSSGEGSPWLQTEYWEASPEFRPDGRWITYFSDESGRDEVYVRPFPGPGPALQLSNAGGFNPSWSPDGREIVYRKTDDEHVFLSVKIRDSEAGLGPERPVELFRRHSSAALWFPSFDVASDGRILHIPWPSDDVLTASLDALMPSRISIVQSWFAELEDKVPSRR